MFTGEIKTDGTACQLTVARRRNIYCQEIKKAIWIWMLLVRGRLISTLDRALLIQEETMYLLASMEITKSGECSLKNIILTVVLYNA